MHKVLIADDDATSRLLLGTLLAKWGYEAEVVGDGVEAWLALRKGDAPKLVIIDWMMPGLDGLDVVRELRAGNPGSYTYILMLTSKGRQEDIVAAMDAGVDDYLKKPFGAQELRARLRAGDRILNLEQKLVCALETSEFRATHDFLTGLHNRGAILDLLKRELFRREREQSALGICIVDVDHFKSINDIYGHLAGDEALKRLAVCMTTAVRPYDSVGRYGGEEFLIIAPNCDLEETAKLAERIRQVVAAAEVEIDDRSITITVSLGASAVSQGKGIATAKALLQAADAALYRAKNTGRNRVEAADMSLTAAPRMP
jgi:diguanylate cyclase (GGDEF)-like protein